MTTTKAAPRCEACRREGTRLEPRLVEKERLMLCTNPTECRQHWPPLEEGYR